MSFKVGIGEDSHPFDETDIGKPCILGGVQIATGAPLQGNSDADVVLHALCNAISGVSGKPIIGEYTDTLCREKGIVDSRFYVEETLHTLQDYRLVHVSVSIECQVPKLAPHMENMRVSIADLVGLRADDVGITATTGEGLTAFGQGKGVHATVIVTAEKNS